MAGWKFMSDVNPRERRVKGRLSNAHISVSGVTADDDTCFDISPDLEEEFQKLLTNRDHYEQDLSTRPPTRKLVKAQPNANKLIECEIHVAEGQRDRHLKWVQSMSGTVVTAQGVWVMDTGHKWKTELHPVDVVFGPATSASGGWGSIEPGDWIGELATQRGLVVGDTMGDTMFAFRIAAASDNRGNFWNWAKPLLAGTTRRTTFTVPFPPRPDGNSVARSELRTFLPLLHASIWRADPVDLNGTMVQPVTVTCDSYEHGGPGTMLAELVTYWAAPPPRASAIPAYQALLLD
jgi:hypothetical protein